MELLYAADSNIKWHNPFEKCWEISTKAKLMYNLEPVVQLLVIYLTEVCTHKKNTTILWLHYI